MMHFKDILLIYIFIDIFVMVMLHPSIDIVHVSG